MLVTSQSRSNMAEGARILYNGCEQEVEFDKRIIQTPRQKKRSTLISFVGSVVDNWEMDRFLEKDGTSKW